MDETARHLRLLTKTIAAVNSTLDLEEVLSLVAREVADALGADACFVYLYDEQADELVLRATFGTRVEEMTGRPRMRPGEGITGTAAAAREPVMIAAQAHLDERFKAFPNLPEDEYESILAVPILARERLEGALNVRTREPREFTGAEIDLLVAIASQVAQTIEHAKLYAQAQRRVVELEALARISEAVSESLYLEESLEGIVAATVDALGATGAALVLEDGEVVWPDGRAGAHAVRVPLRWKGRQVGELVCDRDTPFTADDRALLASIASHAAVALEHGRAVMRGVLAQEIHHRVKNNLQTVASLLRLQARADDVDARKALDDSVNRILAIAAVHEVLTERRDDDVELDELLDRCGRCSSRGSAPPRRSNRRWSRSRWPGTARPRWRSSSRSCCRTRSSTAASRCGSSWPGETATSCWRSPTTARAWTVSRSPARGSRSCAPWSATSSAGRWRWSRTAGCAPRSSSRPEPSPDENVTPPTLPRHGQVTISALRSQRVAGGTSLPTQRVGPRA